MKAGYRKQQGRVLTKHEKNLKRRLQHSENTFENIEQKRRFHVLGQRTQKVTLSKSRSKQIESRKETLLHDFYNATRANTVIDERTVDDAEGNAVGFVVEKLVDDDTRKMQRARERALQRQNRVLAAERRRRQRGAFFDLGDDDSDDDLGGGDDGGNRGNKRNVMKRRRMGAVSGSSSVVFGDREQRIDRDLFAESPVSPVEGEDGVDRDDLSDEERYDLEQWMQGALKRRQKKSQRGALGANTDDGSIDVGTAESASRPRPKSHKERLEEIIDRSKMLREVKSQLRDEVMMETEELDEEFEDMKQYLTPMHSSSLVSKDTKAATSSASVADRGGRDEFDRIFQELAGDTSTSVLHTKNKEKMEQKEREHLVQLEMVRQRRLQEEEEDDDSDDEHGDDDDTHQDIGGGDSLEDGLDIEYDVNDSDNEDISSDEESSTHAKKARGQVIKKVANQKSTAQKKEGDIEDTDLYNDIPYVIRVPGNYEELKGLFDGMTPAQVRVICNRIIMVNSQSDLRTFLQLLLEHFNHLGRYGLQDGSSLVEMLSILSDQIQDLSLRMPSHAAQTFEKVILFMQHNLSVHLNEVTGPLMDSTVHGYPGCELIFFLQLIGNVFPRSEFRHPFISSALLLLHEIISHCPLRTMRDVLYGIFVCSIILDYTKETKRVSPEVIHFLTSLLATAIPVDEHVQTLTMVTMPSKLCDDARQDWLLMSEKTGRGACDRIDLVKHVVMDGADDTLQSSALWAVVGLLHKFTLLYAGVGADALPSVPELLEDTLAVAERLCDHLENTVAVKGTLLDGSKNLVTTLQMSSKRITVQRVPLQAMSTKRVSLFEFEPLIYSENTGNYKGPIVDLDKQRLQKKILQRKVSREKRSAVRELRKDNMFMRKAREQATAREARVRKEKYKRVINTLEQERNMQVQLDAKIHKIDRMRKKMRKQRKMGGRQHQARAGHE